MAEGTLEPVETAEWAAPIVPVVKSDKQSVRICGDFRLTVNPVSKLDNYPIPKVENLFTKLQGGKSFTKLDIHQAYQQLELADESKKYVVISTHKAFPIHKVTLRDSVSTWYVSACDGESFERHQGCDHVHQ